MTKMTPQRAVRAYCMGCGDEGYSHVQACDGNKPDTWGNICPLFPYRLGKGAGRVKVKTIRAKCKQCMLGQNNEIKACPTEVCPLWVYRMAKDPFSTRKGNPAALEKYRAGV